MSRDGQEFLAVVIVGAVFFAVIGGILWAWNSYSCAAKWEKSGFQTDYGPVQGCLISKDGESWIPAENYRDIP